MNSLKTGLLLSLMSAVLLVGGEEIGGRSGLEWGLMLAVAMNFAGYFFSDKLALMSYSAQPVTPEDNPEAYARLALDWREEGAQIVADPRQAIPMKMIGHVTSSYWSENCGRSIALALVAGGRDRLGDTLYVPMPDGVIEVEVCGTVFFDEKGERLNG